MQPAGQTIFVHQPNPVQLNSVAPLHQPPTPGVSIRFNGGAGATTGFLQLFLGVASMIVGSIQIDLLSTLSFVGYGIWAGILFFIPTGILGISSAKKKTCVIVAYMVMCIFSAVIASIMLIFETVISVYSYDYEYEDGSFESDIVLANIGLVEMIVAIVGSVYCCAEFCCSSPSRQFATTMVTRIGAPMVVTTAAPFPQQQPPNALPTFAQPSAYNAQHAFAKYPTQSVQM